MIRERLFSSSKMSKVQNGSITTKRDLVQELTPKVQIKMEHFFLQKSLGGSENQ
jgi:hypothetical protein